MGSIASLVLTWHRLHPPLGGAALRNWQNIRALAELGPVDVVSVGPGDGGPPPPPVRRWVHFDLSRLPSRRGLPGLLRRSWWVRPRAHPWAMALWRDEIIEAVTKMARTGHSELAVLEELWFHPYCTLTRELECLTVFDAHNVESRLRREIAPTAAGLIDRFRTKRLTHQVVALERDLVSRVDQTWCCSETDARQLGGDAGRPHSVRVIPNTVDTDYYGPVRDGSIAPASDAGGRGPVIVFVGAFSYGPNEMAARVLVHEILPALERERRDVSLLLVGRDPAPWMLEEARKRRGVRVTGAVPDVRPYLAEASVIAVPLTHGGGTRLKILEAFAALRPVVSTPKGAEGLGAIDGVHLHLRAIDEFPETVLKLLSDPVAAAGLTRRALDLVEQNYSWPVAAGRIRSAVAELVQRSV
ncbi:MAG: glycosyltransferase [Planctomycetes bacterium]|nr:glycosyltransferase [Planctomycetota bacterium]